MTASNIAACLTKIDSTKAEKEDGTQQAMGNFTTHSLTCLSPAENKSEVEPGNDDDADPDGGRDWSSLPADIVGLISGHLVMEENIFRAVCKSWQSAPTYSPSNYSDPWLFYMRRNQNRCRAVSPFGRRSLDMELPSQLVGCEIRCCRDGWLLFERDRVNFILFNPLSGEIFDGIPKAPQLFANIWFKPPGEVVCTVVGFLAHVMPVSIGIWKFGEEKWSVYSMELEKPDHKLSGGCRMTRLGNKFYVMGPDGGVGVFDPEAEDVVSSFCHWNISVPMNKSRPNNDYFAPYHSPCYLVETNREQLFSVFETIPDRTIRIFSLNLKKRRWKEIRHLGHQTLFLSTGRCFFKLLPIKKLRNKIFFPKFGDDMSYMLYCPLTKKFSSLNGQLSTSTAVSLKDFHNASWFTSK